MMRRRYAALALSLLLCGLIQQGAPPGRAGPGQIPAGRPAARVLGLALMPRTDPPLTAQNFTQRVVEATDQAYAAGVRGTNVSYTWKDLEPSAGRYTLSDLDGGLSYMGAVRGFTLDLGIQLLNTTAKETPPDLLGVPFDAPLMQRRFRALVDALLPHLNRHVRYLAIGNEVDVYLAAHPQEWAPYRVFYRAAVAYVHRRAPWIEVGVTSTFDGARGATASEVASLNAASDVYMVTYYPLGADFVVRAPEAALADIPTMVQLAGGRPIVLQEVGYPTSSSLGSSERKQAAFVANVFRAWSAAGARIPFLSFFMQHDFSRQTCDELARYYGLPGSANFKEYLCTLGLRRTTGTPKLGWQALVAGAAALKAGG